LKKFKFRKINGFNKFLQIILISIFLFIFPINTYSAELLQIKDVNNILVGDQNRSLYLSLYCIDINPNEEEKATEILKKNFPRGTKIKIKPYGINGNRLFAKIFRVDDETEMTELLNSFLNHQKKICMN
tara:strand:+ start:169 stop:555 length:387 start_codon:yes stop_codon:yes gene_type:complete